MLARAEPAPIAFKDLRSDWYYGADYMARLIKRAIANPPGPTFLGFPKQWIPIFLYFDLCWKGSCEPRDYIPLISPLTVPNLLKAAEDAQVEGHLRLLIEAIASVDNVVGETLQRLDTARLAPREQHQEAQLRLTNWFGYMRPEVRAFEEDLATWKPSKRSAAFLPCGRARPYDHSATHKRLIVQIQKHGVDLRDHDVIVLTSLGPVPQSMWQHPTVMRYDTGVRDIYRMLTLLRRLITPAGYDVGLDCLGFRPYRDLLQIIAREGRIRHLERPGAFRGRVIPTYKGAVFK